MPVGARAALKSDVLHLGQNWASDNSITYVTDHINEQVSKLPRDEFSGRLFTCTCESHKGREEAMTRQFDDDDVDEKIAKEMLRLMPELPSTLDGLFKKVEQFDHREPTPFIAEMRAEMGGPLSSLEVNKLDVLQSLGNLLTDLPMKEEARRRLSEIIKITKSEASKDPRYSLLLRLMSEADKKVPLISIIVTMRHGDPIETLEPQCRPYDLLEQAGREHGEVRATAALRALAETVEALYRPYLITVWALSYFKEGEVPPQQIPASGNLVKEAFRRLPDYPGLIEPDAVWMRNSAIHNPRKYNYEDDALEMWDKGRAPRSVSVINLYAMVERIYQISGETIQRVGQLYMFRKFSDSGLLDELVESFPQLLSENENEVKQAEERLSAKAQELLRPMTEFFEAHTPPQSDES